MMTDDIRDIADYYNNRPQSEHTRLEQHQLENDLTWRFLEEYLPRKVSILEIGAATGLYTLGLLERGYAVTAYTTVIFAETQADSTRICISLELPFVCSKCSSKFVSGAHLT
jgi:hypothetical protein